MSVFTQVTKGFRHGNRYVPRRGRPMGGGQLLGLGTASAEVNRTWRVVLWTALALVLTQAQSGLLPHLGMPEVRVEIPILIAAFAALQLPALEGALTAYAAGWVAELFLDSPPGLGRFCAVSAWVIVRLMSGRIQLSPTLGTFAFTGLAATLYGAGVLLGTDLVAEPGSGPGTIPWVSVVPTAALTAAVAVPLSRLLDRIDRATSRAEV